MTREAEGMYKGFSWNGIVEQNNGPHPSIELHNGTLITFHEAADIVNMDANASAATMCGFSQPTAKGPQFMMFRTILQPATFMTDAATQLARLCGDHMTIVSPHEAAYLARLVAGADNSNIVTYLADSLPRASLPAHVTVATNFTLRNDGWNTLNATNCTLQVTVGATATTCQLAQDILPAQTVVVPCHVTMPAVSGPTSLNYGLVCSAQTMRTPPYNIATSVAE